jgi:hypothetical protein
MSEFLKTSELTETKAFVRSFVKEVLVRPGGATIIYTIPTPQDSPIGGRDAAEIALDSGVRSIRYGGGLAVARILGDGGASAPVRSPSSSATTCSKTVSVVPARATTK